ncbi:MAG: cation transporter [Clostridia bacterium]|nr:cation transporter [Clostridia bacterium]
MFTLLCKLFIKDNKNYENNRVREGYGKLSGILGIVLNALLFLAKLIAGIVTGAISVIADALNNLTDAGSSLITFIGFKLSSKPTDKEHPFGHGRMEYVAGFVVSMLIFLVAFELAKESITKLITPTELDFSILAVVILALSILVKLYMFTYNYSTAKKIKSSAMKATATDCLTDCISTTVILATLIVYKFTNFNIDAIAGLLVSVLIFYAGFTNAKETIDLLIGTAPDPEYVQKIAEKVLSIEGIIGIHDLIVHNYGPGRQIISMHAEVDAEENVNEAHDKIDNAEIILEREFNCIAVIHMDPIVQNDERVNRYKGICNGVIKAINPDFSLHDFRMTIGTTHINLIFDLTIPHACTLTESEIKTMVNEGVKAHDSNLNVVCKVEKNYVGLK